MEAGTSARMKNDPSRVGILTGEVREIAGVKRYRVSFPDGTKSYYPEYELEIVGDDAADEWTLLEQGKYGRVSDLRRNLTQIRLSGRLADLVYSMDTTNTRFYAHQFKPVLRFLDSPSNGLLIADEVGLGKTIEAGLIWTELRSRYDARRLLVLCPAMLREKWRDELRNRFGVEPKIMGPGEVLADLKNERHSLVEGRAIVCSMQGLRPPKGWDDPEAQNGNSPSAELARFLAERTGTEPLIDLLVIDEAAYLRNDSTQTHKLGQLLREVSEHVVLLSATPIALSSFDLFVLLKLIDPDSFDSKHVFPEVLSANAPLIRTRAAALNPDSTAAEILALLREAKDCRLLASSRQLADLLNDPPTDEQLRNTDYRTRFADRLERLNLLDSVVSRTRKREVQEWRVLRQARQHFVDMKAQEREFYRLVTDAVRDYAIARDIHDGFLLATPQRQMSSCMAAAAESWQARTSLDDGLLYEDFGSDSKHPEVGELVQHIAARVLPYTDIAALRANDSKYECLRESLVGFFGRNNNEKIVLFSYFRRTLLYLQQRLAADGIRSRVLMGGMSDDKQEYIAGFRDAPQERVLLSSEVAAEGVDLQFCWVLVNYDMPWNPMKVEQRIGRIDRLGQEAPIIHIWNLGYRDTIDERIFSRLHQRLGIFEHALGGLEAILGEEVRKLTSDLLTQKLSSDQEEARIRQTELAIAAVQHETERLEENAAALIAHGGYILEQVRAARDFSRRITARDLTVFIHDHLTRYFQGSEMRQIDNEGLFFDLKLSPPAASALADFIRSKRLRGGTQLVAGLSRPVRCEIRNQVEIIGRGKNEQISQFHPLVRFISNDIKTRDDPFYTLVAMQISAAKLPDIEPGEYAFMLHLWSQEGVRGILEKLAFRAFRMVGEGRSLSPEDSERLISRCAIDGHDWLEAGNLLESALIRKALEFCLAAVESDYHAYQRQAASENADRASFQLESARRSFKRQLDVLQSVIAKHRAHGRSSLVAATQGRIDKLTEQFRIRESDLKRKEQFNINYRQVCMGALLVS